MATSTRGGKKSAVKSASNNSGPKKVAKKTASKTAGKKTTKKKTAKKKWSGRVNETSDAMDLAEGVFKGNDPKKIAASVKRSATKSKRKKASPYQSAMSMLNFYLNRGGKNLSASKKKTLEKAKDVLREMFGREE